MQYKKQQLITNNTNKIHLHTPFLFKTIDYNLYMVCAQCPYMKSGRGCLKRLESRHCKGAARSNPVINSIPDCFASLAMAA
jgi:hypothetical protein